MKSVSNLTGDNKSSWVSFRNMTETGPKIVESKEDGKEGQAVTCQLLPGGFAGTGTVSM